MNKIKGADGKWYEKIEIGRGQYFYREVKDNKFISFLKRIFK